jgi:hydroxyacylglutathione hydrolase
LKLNGEDLAQNFSTDSELIFRQLIREESGCASYVIGSSKTRKCLIVDPLRDTERYTNLLDDLKLEQVLALVDTHTHADHLSGTRSFSSLFPNASIAMHESAPVNFPCLKLVEGESLTERFPTLFRENIAACKIIYTPGHASDHISLFLETAETNKIILTGDCLLIGDVGRIDLGRGDIDLLYESLFHKILDLPPKTEVYPAHVGAKHYLSSGRAKSTIGEEKYSNPVLLTKTREEFFKYMTEGWPPKPDHYQEIIKINLGILPQDTTL